MDKETYILNNGWEKRGNLYVRTEWLNESKKYNLPPHLCPNWYRHETLENAYKITINKCHS